MNQISNTNNMLHNYPQIQQMQSTQKQQARIFTKRHNSTTAVTANATTIKQSSQANLSPKLPIFRKTDYTDEITSEATNSQIGPLIRPHLVRDEVGLGYGGEPRGDKGRARRESQIGEELVAKEGRVVELRERLKNIHHFYKVRIEEERNKNIERSQIFIGIIEELQMIHNQKILNLQKTYEVAQQGQSSVGGVDSRIQSINKKIEQVINRSQQIKSQNENLQQQILRKHQINEQKQSQLADLKNELHQMQQKLQHFQKLKLKENRRGRQLMEMISTVVG